MIDLTDDNVQDFFELSIKFVKEKTDCLSQSFIEDTDSLDATKKNVKTLL